MIQFGFILSPNKRNFTHQVLRIVGNLLILDMEEALYDYDGETGGPVWFDLGPLGGEGSGAAPAKEVVQYQGDARGSGQQAAGWTRTR